MTAWRQAIELAIGEKDLAELRAIARSRTEPVSRVERARMLLAYREDRSFFAVAQDMGVHHQTVQRCVERALAYESDSIFMPMISGSCQAAGKDANASKEHPGLRAGDCFLKVFRQTSAAIEPS